MNEPKMKKEEISRMENLNLSKISHFRFRAECEKDVNRLRKRMGKKENVLYTMEFPIRKKGVDDNR
jgi:hypothetical protein